MVNYHCAVNNQRGRNLQGSTQNFFGLYIYISVSEEVEAGWEAVVVGHVCGGVTTGVSPIDAPVTREGESNCVAEDITQRDFGKERSSNCNPKRHCSKSLRAGVE